MEWTLSTDVGQYLTSKADKKQMEKHMGRSGDPDSQRILAYILEPLSILPAAAQATGAEIRRPLPVTDSLGHGQLLSRSRALVCCHEEKHANAAAACEARDAAPLSGGAQVGGVGEEIVQKRLQ